MFPVVLLEDKVTEPPTQNVVGPLAVTVGVAGIGFTTTVLGTEVPLVQEPLETLTEYVPAVVTMMD